MCTGVEVALIAASLAASAASASAAHQGAKAQANYQSRANEIATDQIKQEADATRMDQERHAQQQYEQQASEVNAYETDALKQRASLEALIGELGGGNTGDRKLTSLGMGHDQDLTTIAQNGNRRNSEAGFANSAQLTSINSKVAGLAPVSKPSSNALYLSLASSALQAGTRMYSASNSKPGAGTKA